MLVRGRVQHEELEAAWREVLGSWDDGAAHRRFLVLCQASGALAEAGKRYREVRESDAGRRAEAEKRIDEILALALSSLAATKTEPPPKRRPWLLIVAVAVASALVLTALSMWLRSS